MCVCKRAHMWRSKDSSQEARLSFHYMGPGSRSNHRVWWQDPSPPSQLTGLKQQPLFSQQINRNGLDHGTVFSGVLALTARFWICAQPIHHLDLSSPHRKLFTVVPSQSGHVEVNSLHARPVPVVSLHQPVLQQLRTENLTVNEMHLLEWSG